MKCKQVALIHTLNENKSDFFLQRKLDSLIYFHFTYYISKKQVICLKTKSCIFEFNRHFWSKQVKKNAFDFVRKRPELSANQCGMKQCMCMDNKSACNCRIVGWKRSIQSANISSVSLNMFATLKLKFKS